jgi:hypothetical protein
VPLADCLPVLLRNKLDFCSNFFQKFDWNKTPGNYMAKTQVFQTRFQAVPGLFPSRSKGVPS